MNGYLYHNGHAGYPVLFTDYNQRLHTAQRWGVQLKNVVGTRRRVAILVIALQHVEGTACVILSPFRPEPCTKFFQEGLGLESETYRTDEALARYSRQRIKILEHARTYPH